MKNTHIDAQAKIGKNVYIGPFSFIDKNVTIGDDTWIGPNVTIFEGARIGKNCKIHPGSIISGVPQDLKFEGEVTTTEIGDGTIIRECVTVNRGTKYAHKTVIGANCLLMAYVHVAHDCIIGDHVILANNVNLAGHVEIDDWAILEGLAAVQQFTRIGKHAFIAGASLVRKNVPPYVKAAREPLAYAGINSVGLKRRDFDSDQINRIHEIYRILFVKGYRISSALEIIKIELKPSKEREAILEFVAKSEMGIIRGFKHMGEETFRER